MKTINIVCKLLLLSFAIFFHTAINAEIKVTYYIPDASGSPVAATDEQGKVLWRAHRMPFGAEVNKDPASSNNHIGFTGHVHDSSTGLTYMGARYYDPIVGRFMGMDPVGVNPEDPRTFNRFSYANNNPYKFVDPDGRLSILIESIGVGLIGFGILTAVNPEKSKEMTAPLLQGWKAFNEGGNDDGDTDAVQEEFDSLDAAVGSVDPLDDVEFEGKTKNRGLKEQGFTEKWTGVDSDGIYQSGFRNPETGKWTGGHESSRNNQNN